MSRTCAAAHAAEAQPSRLSAVGSLVGAGGVTAYNTYHNNDWGIVKTLQWWIEKGQADTARANNPELARLEDMVFASCCLAVTPTSTLCIVLQRSHVAGWQTDSGHG